MAARLEHVHALVADDGDRLDAASESFETIGALLLASEAANAAAAVHRHTAMRRKATASAQRAATLLAECEGALPFGVEPGVPGVSLTRREREVAELAAHNLTSREIAEKLFVSTRTVENHLQRAYEKLGVRGRRELRQALGPGGDVL
jgi:DNA-binding CsgD family transcriptional regulator